jgi:hypothetical protein
MDIVNHAQFRAEFEIKSDFIITIEFEARDNTKNNSWEDSCEIEICD